MADDLAIRTGLAAKLAGDSAIAALVGERIYDSEAPKSATFPLIIFSLYSAEDAYTYGAHAWSDDLWIVKAVDTDESGQDDAIAALIFAALNDQALSGVTTLYLRRQRRMRYPEPHGDITYRHSGGIYRLWTS